MPAFQDPRVKIFETTRNGGVANNASPIVLENSYVIAGARAVGDVDELFVLRPKQRIVEVNIWAASGLAAADGNVTFGILEGDLGGNPSTTALEADRGNAAERREPVLGAHSLNAQNISNALDLTLNSTRMLLNVSADTDRAVGFKWTGVRASAGAASNRTVFVAIRIEMPPASRVV